MTSAANDVPDFRSVHELRRAHKCCVAWHPALFRDQPRERKSDLGVTFARRHPKNLHVVRTRYQTDSNIDRFRESFSRCRQRYAFHVHPEFVVSPAQHESIAFVGESDIMEISSNRIGRRDLGHRPVVTSVPAFELILVTRTAGLRPDVPWWPANVWQYRFVSRRCAGPLFVGNGRGNLLGTTGYQQ